MERDIDAGEIQYELVEACENFPDEMYVPIFIKENMSLYQKAPTWFEILFQSILNTDSCLQRFLQLVSDVKKEQYELFAKSIKTLSIDNKEYNKVYQTLNKKD